MSKKKTKTDDKTLSIFEYLNRSKVESSPKSQHRPGAFSCIDRLRLSLAEAVKSCPLSAFQVAGEMGHCLNETITADMIYSWTRQSDEINGRTGRHIPAEYLPAFCHVTGCNRPIEIMGELVGLFVLPGPDALRADIQKLSEEIASKKKAVQKRRLLLKELEGVDE